MSWRFSRPLQAISQHVQASLGRRGLVSAAEIKFGQPLHETHPHLVKAGELTPGISALEYHHRRAELAKRLPRGSIAVLAASDVKYRSGAVFYDYHQDSNFFYLTGFKEPESLAVIEKGQSDVEYTFHLFVRPKDERAETWDGARSGVQAAQDVFNADEAYDINNIRSTLPDLIRSAKAVYTDIGTPVRSQGALEKFTLGTGTRVEGMQHALKDATVRPLRQVMNEIRLKKSQAELDCMRRAGAISGAVFTEAMKVQHRSEKQLWTDLGYGFRSQGLDGEAYVPVVAGGQNGLSIHYVRNDELLHDGQTVLVDAGGEYGGYITDITRTWPVSGRWTAPQKDLYSMVLRAQRQLVELCRETADMTLDRLHRRTEELLSQGLRDLGFDLRGSALDKLFPHHVGHYIGLDVHDAPGYQRTTPLQEGHCITIEPGIYVPDDNRWPEAFRGLAVRIEDSVIIGKDSVEVLTRTAVKDADEIEALRSL
ncbi:hypothetical protein AMS68_007415 [Peltaster fructicola]|uniref:Xaa-Pro aminopeptidase n=1 Tax=Peltaster fructicola TaxID=286661 RepID=A0A6H0Y4Y1_9PEZI|nr:hypothetical protein AMS68_007415 [Peltaster fructicola]